MLRHRFYTDLRRDDSATLYSVGMTQPITFLFFLRLRLLYLEDTQLCNSLETPFARGCLTVCVTGEKPRVTYLIETLDGFSSSARGVRLRAIFTEPRIIYKVDWRLKRIAPTF